MLQYHWTHNKILWNFLRSHIDGTGYCLHGTRYCLHGAGKLLASSKQGSVPSNQDLKNSKVFYRKPVSPMMLV